MRFAVIATSQVGCKLALKVSVFSRAIAEPSCVSYDMTHIAGYLSVQLDCYLSRPPDFSF